MSEFWRDKTKEKDKGEYQAKKGVKTGQMNPMFISFPTLHFTLVVFMNNFWQMVSSLGRFLFVVNKIPFLFLGMEY